MDGEPTQQTEETELHTGSFVTPGDIHGVSTDGSESFWDNQTTTWQLNPDVDLPFQPTGKFFFF